MLEETEGDSDTVEAFNTDLRDLRSMHGNPPYKVLEERSYKLLGPNGGVGKTTLHNAVTDRALASERAVKALVMSLTSSPELTEQWIQRRSRLASAEAPHVVNILETPSTNSASSRERRTRRRRTAAFIAALVGTNVLTGLAVAALSGGPQQTRTLPRPRTHLPGRTSPHPQGPTPDAHHVSLMRESRPPTRRPPTRTFSSNSSGPRHATRVGDGSHDRTAKVWETPSP